MLYTLIILAILIIPSTLIFINKINKAKYKKQSLCSTEFFPSTPPSLPDNSTLTNYPVYLIVTFSTSGSRLKEYNKSAMKVVSSAISEEELILLATGFAGSKKVESSRVSAYVIFNITDPLNATRIASSQI